MNTHKLLSDFDSAIRLNDSKKSKLKSNQSALRNKIKKHFKDNDWGTPKFHTQGSFLLNTNLNPIKKTTGDGEVKEEYDLDDGVYFICSEADRKEPATYHDRIMKAVKGHGVSEVDKATCVRVIYTDGHHIDLPSYWLAIVGDAPQLTHKSNGYTDSDPKEFKSWVDKKISNVNSNGQLRRVIRYLKAWKDYREDSNSSLRMPSGFILTILACNNFVASDQDDASLRKTLIAIKSKLDFKFECYRPTTPTNEELLGKYSKDSLLDELDKIIINANKVDDSDCEYESSEHWRKSFGHRFPLGKKKEGKPASTVKISGIAATAISRPFCHD